MNYLCGYICMKFLHLFQTQLWSTLTENFAIWQTAKLFNSFSNSERIKSQNIQDSGRLCSEIGWIRKHSFSNVSSALMWSRLELLQKEAGASLLGHNPSCRPMISGRTWAKLKSQRRFVVLIMFKNKSDVCKRVIKSLIWVKTHGWNLSLASDWGAGHLMII